MLLGAKLNGPSAQDVMAHFLQKKSWFNLHRLKQIKMSFSLTFDLFILSISFRIAGDSLDLLLCLLSPPFPFHMSEILNSFSMGRRGRQSHLGMTFWEQTAPKGSPKEEFLELSLPEVSMCLRAQTCNATQNMYPCLILWHVCFSEKKPMTILYWPDLLNINEGKCYY